MEKTQIKISLGVYILTIVILVLVAAIGLNVVMQQYKNKEESNSKTLAQEKETNEIITSGNAITEYVSSEEIVMQTMSEYFSSFMGEGTEEQEKLLDFKINDIELTGIIRSLETDNEYIFAHISYDLKPYDMDGAFNPYAGSGSAVVDEEGYARNYSSNIEIGKKDGKYKLIQMGGGITPIQQCIEEYEEYTTWIMK